MSNGSGCAWKTTGRQGSPACSLFVELPSAFSPFSARPVQPSSALPANNRAIPGCSHPLPARYPAVFLTFLPLPFTALRAKPSNAKPPANQVEASGTGDESGSGQGFWDHLRL